MRVSPEGRGLAGRNPASGRVFIQRARPSVQPFDVAIVQTKFGQRPAFGGQVVFVGAVDDFFLGGADCVAATVCRDGLKDSHLWRNSFSEKDGKDRKDTVNTRRHSPEGNSKNFSKRGAAMIGDQERSGVLASFFRGGASLI